jgi:glycosyltransferase involved in cell wall biosynthesis
VDALRRADRVLVHTLADLDRLDRLGLSATTTLLPHGVPAALPRPAIRRLAATDPLIGCYGFFLPGKGIDVLIRALAILRRRWPGARLVLVNAEYDHQISREEIARCSDLIDSLGLAGAVRLETGFMPNHASLDLLTACDVVALPYLPSKEASSAALRGALAAGAPVAVTPIALFDEAGDAVFRFAGHAEEAVAEGLDRLLGDAALRARIQDAAQDWVGQRRWTDVARVLEGMITGLARSTSIERGRAG